MLNPCKNCGDVDNIGIHEDIAVCFRLACNNQVDHDGTLQNAIDAWNAANPINDAKMGQNDALAALQRAVARLLMAHYGVNNVIQRGRVGGDHNLRVFDLLISQGVLVETDGRITIK